jgi:hypothetical protein
MRMRVPNIMIERQNCFVAGSFWESLEEGFNLVHSGVMPKAKVEGRRSKVELGLWLGFEAEEVRSAIGFGGQGQID